MQTKTSIGYEQFWVLIRRLEIGIEALIRESRIELIRVEFLCLNQHSLT